VQRAPLKATRSRRIALALCAVVALGTLASTDAGARDLKPYWGTAYIDDNPFLDPSTRQLLPAGKVVPRGWILDSYTDDHRIRMRVTAYNTAGAPVYSYYVDERNGVRVNFDRTIDVTPTALGSIGYDFCRQKGETGTPDACVAQVRLNRPVPPPPPAAPPPAVVPTTTTPATTTAPPSTTVPATTVPPVTPPPAEPSAPTLTVEPAPAGTTGPLGCVPHGQPIRFRLALKRSGAGKRTRILRVTFFLKHKHKHKHQRKRKVVVDRRAPYRASLPVALPAGTKTRGYARIRYRVKGRRGAFTRTVSQRFTICP
jgi:hypothetical protein